MASQQLLGWLVSGGGSVHPDITFRSTDSGERGIFAAAPLPARTELISVPHALCMHVPRPTPGAPDHAANTAADAAHQVRVLEHCDRLLADRARRSPEKLRQRLCCSAQPSKKARLDAAMGPGRSDTLTPAARWLAQRADDVEEFAAAVLLLMAEVAAGVGSPFASLVAALPPSHHCVMAWEPEELAHLRGTAVEKDLPDARAFFLERVVPVAAQHRELWPEGAWCACPRIAAAADAGVHKTLRSTSRTDRSWTASEVACTLQSHPEQLVLQTYVIARTALSCTILSPGVRH